MSKWTQLQLVPRELWAMVLQDSEFARPRKLSALAEAVSSSKYSVSNIKDFHKEENNFPAPRNFKLGSPRRVNAAFSLQLKNLCILNQNIYF